MGPVRPYWKGYLKLSLVSCPIALYAGTASTERVSFRQINKKTGNRLRQQLVDDVTREVVEGPDKGRGYEYSKNAYSRLLTWRRSGYKLSSPHGPTTRAGRASQRKHRNGSGGGAK
jgi:DNA end-binding protein Ku